MKGSTVLRHLCSHEGPISFSGRYTNFREMLFEPKPARRGGPPIWVGGMTHPSLRRGARVAEGGVALGVSEGKAGGRAGKSRANSGGRKNTTCCFSPAGVGTKANAGA